MTPVNLPPAGRHSPMLTPAALVSPHPRFISALDPGTAAEGEGSTHHVTSSGKDNDALDPSAIRKNIMTAPDLSPRSPSSSSVTSVAIAGPSRSSQAPDAEYTGYHPPHPLHGQHDIISLQELESGWIEGGCKNGAQFSHKPGPQPHKSSPSSAGTEAPHTQGGTRFSPLPQYLHLAARGPVAATSTWNLARQHYDTDATTPTQRGDASTPPRHRGGPAPCHYDTHGSEASSEVQRVCGFKVLFQPYGASIPWNVNRLFAIYNPLRVRTVGPHFH
ncbi:hypothetical protein EDB92DRAFT_1819949 [Lactarius akahatsu]|uniref:Uncharacterized protein n=1 Tax=Lactarius akahatsu TaxID=416441 RepID=A0AAD4L8S9_9AGAM|nr:hypothetical protein EDB92DRAFT_1819949 [Lactarius akahatsu]